MNVKKLKLRQKFVQEGRFAAIPLKMPGETFAIPDDESSISAIIESPDGRVFYGATSGAECHIFAGSAKGSSRGIIDLGVVEGAKLIPVMTYAGNSCSNPRLPCDIIIFAANFVDGAHFYRVGISFPKDTFQEPSFMVPQIEQICFLPGYQVCDAVLTPDGHNLLCLTTAGIWSLCLASNHILAVAELDLSSAPICKFAVVGDAAFFVGESGRIMRLDMSDIVCSDTAMAVPFTDPGCGFCVVDNKIIAANSTGKLFAFEPERSEVVIIGQVMLPDVQCMSSLPDGRIYGVCGRGIGYFFKFDTTTGETEDMGAIASALEDSRYGFEFSTMLTGRDGEIYMGENDRGGHLWIYFPSVNSRNS
jgi:hypothetical protein